MRSFRVLFALPLLALLTHAPAVDAKPKGDAKADEEPKLPTIVPTGVAEFDPTFMAAKDIHTKIDTQNTALKDAKKGVNKAANVAEDASLDTALTALKTAANGKLELDNSGPTPRVKAANGAPDDVKNAATAINKLMDAGEATAGVAKDLAPAAAELAEKAAAFPEKAKNLDPQTLLTASAKITADVKATVATKDRVERLAKSAEEVIAAVSKAFAQ
jgi:hypothetical protein